MTSPSPDDIATVLKHLPPHTKSTFIAEKAKDQDMPWLRGMAEQGAFLVPVSDFDQEPFDSNVRFIGSTDLSFPNVVALAGVIDGVDMGIAKQSNCVMRTRPVTLAVSNEFKDFLHDTTMALMQSAVEFRENEKPPEPPIGLSTMGGSRFDLAMKKHTQRLHRFGLAINATLLVLLQTACACDDGKTANRLLQAVEPLGTMFSPSNLLGRAAVLIPYKEELRSQVRVNPMYTAMLFSAHTALDAMEQHGYPLQKTIALFPRYDGEARSTDPLKSQYPETHSARMPVDFIANETLPCTGRMLERVLRGQIENGCRAIEVDPLVKPAYRLLTKHRTPYENEHMAAFVNASVFELKGKESVRWAIRSLEIEMVDRLKGFINWLEDVPFGGTQYHWEVTSLFTHPMAGNVRASLESDRPTGSKAMVLKLMDLGTEAGQGHRFYEQGPHQAALAKWSIEQDHPEVLVKLLENGLEPDGFLSPDGTALGLAQKTQKPAAEHLMRTFMSRKKARDVLWDMDNDAKTTSPSFNPGQG